MVFTAACGAVPEEQLAADGKPLPKFYDLSKVDAATLQFRMLDAVNALRSSAGLNQLTLNAELTAAAATHSRDMALQNRPWHFGSDGSSPLDRAERVGYENQFLGETILIVKPLVENHFQPAKTHGRVGARAQSQVHIRHLGLLRHSGVKHNHLGTPCPGAFNHVVDRRPE